MADTNATFTDDSGNHVREFRYGDDYRLRVVVLVSMPTKGYITDTQWGNAYPGPCLTWFGPGERFDTITQAYDYCQAHYNAQWRKGGQQ